MVIAHAITGGNTKKQSYEKNYFTYVVTARDKCWGNKGSNNSV
jgi:hypothetical protein